MVKRQAKCRVNDDPVKRVVTLVANRGRAGDSGGVRHQGQGRAVVPPGLDAMLG